ncbi:hypothetical protein Pan216_33640 [Planctomycetes bacterium Pan216]|uniref:Knr4/Smi1-like domain-containing protein n=1 Tax=Kolteria novifilia TaxID=2527975 RepID=A0A518B696_9BACT|nr:hypothetical protein Pan216_33640 [Planctomycetes bacterium Pan216]
MDPSAVQSQAVQWGVSLPDTYITTLRKIEPEDEIGFWRLDDPVLDPSVLAPGGPVGLFPIGNNGMGDYLCFYAGAGNAKELPLVMWEGETNRISWLGNRFDDFLRREFEQRIEFLVERGQPLTEEQVTKAKQGESFEVDGVDEETRAVVEMLGDACRVAALLEMPEQLFKLAQGDPSVETESKEIDASNENALDAAIDRLSEQATAGDGAAAFEAAGFFQIQQLKPKMAEWLFKACSTLMASWPDFSPERFTKVVQLVKEEAASLPPATRIDPLFAFLSGKASAKSAAFLGLAKDYARKKKSPQAIRAAENALFLASTPEEQKAAYDFLISHARSNDNATCLAYGEAMAGRLAGAAS